MECNIGFSEMIYPESSPCIEILGLVSIDTPDLSEFSINGFFDSDGLIFNNMPVIFNILLLFDMSFDLST